MTLIPFSTVFGPKINQSGENAGIVVIFLSAEEAAGSVPTPEPAIFQQKTRSAS